MAVVSASPPLELLDHEEIEALWATVDYTTMTQEAKSPNIQNGIGASPNWEYIFDMSMNAIFPTTATQLGAVTAAPSMQTPDRTTHYNNMLASSIEPYPSFFNEDGVGNFGH